jgi:hypothetical protein
MHAEADNAAAIPTPAESVFNAENLSTSTPMERCICARLYMYNAQRESAGCDAAGSSAARARPLLKFVERGGPYALRQIAGSKT